MAEGDKTCSSVGGQPWAWWQGQLQWANMNLAAAFGPVSGLTGTMVFDDLLDLKTKPAQKVSLREVNPGIAILDGEIEYQLTGGSQVRIEGGQWLDDEQVKLARLALVAATAQVLHNGLAVLGVSAPERM